MTRAQAEKKSVTRRSAMFLRRRGWSYDTPRNGLRTRIVALLDDRHPWWDWGHRLMIVVGSDFGGNWAEPRPPTWWYRRGPAKPMARTGFRTHPLSTYEVITSYSEFRDRTAGLNEDQMYEWQAIGTNQDGELHLGHQYWGGQFFGLASGDVALLRRYLRMWRRLDWWGLRSWLWKQGLHAAVHAKKPRSCYEVPPRGMGGYDHWHCELRRGHAGMHRFRSHLWGEVDGEPICAHVPEVTA